MKQLRSMLAYVLISAMILSSTTYASESSLQSTSETNEVVSDTVDETQSDITDDATPLPQTDEVIDNSTEDISQQDETTEVVEPSTSEVDVPSTQTPKVLKSKTLKNTKSAKVSYSLSFNDVSATNESSPYVVNNILYLPLASLKAVNATVVETNGTTKVTYGKNTLVYDSSTSLATYNGVNYPLTKEVYNNDLALADVCNAFGFTFTTDDTNKKVNIDTPANILNVTHKADATSTSIMIESDKKISFTDSKSGNTINVQFDSALQNDITNNINNSYLSSYSVKSENYSTTLSVETKCSTSYTVESVKDEKGDKYFTTIKVNPLTATLSKPTYYYDGRTSMVTLKSDVEISPTASKSGSKLTVTVPNAKVSGYTSYKNVSDYITSYEIYNSGSDVKLVFTLKSGINYQIVKTATGSQIKLKQDKATPISYDPINTRIVMNKSYFGVTQGTADLTKVKQYDLYYNGYYTFKISNASNLKNFGTKKNLDTYRFNKVTTFTKGNDKYLRVYQNKISAYTLSQSTYAVYIKGLNPNQVYDKIVVLDAGHGGRDSGATRFGVREKNITLDIAKRVETSIKAKDKSIKVYQTRVSDVYPSLLERSRMANDIGANEFVSIHINSSASTSAKGIETFWKTYNTNKLNSVNSKALASEIYKNMQATKKFSSRGVKYANFSVLRNTTMASALVEVGFVSNTSDRNKIKSASTRQIMADSIATGIVNSLK